MKRTPKKSIYIGAVADIVMFIWVYKILDQEIAIYSHLVFSFLVIMIALRITMVRVSAISFLTGLWALMILLVTNVTVFANSAVHAHYGKDGVLKLIILELMLFIIGVGVSYLVNRKKRFKIEDLIRFKYLNENTQTIIIDSDLGQLLETGRNYEKLLPFAYTLVFLFGMGVVKYESSSQVSIMVIAILVSLFFFGYLAVKGYAVFEVINRYKTETGKKLFVDVSQNNNN